MITDWVAEWLAARVMMGLSSMFGGIFGGGVQSNTFVNTPTMPGSLKIPYEFANGGSYQGGLALVGERGPEIINFNRGGYVYNATQTKEMIKQSTESKPIVINMNITTPDANSFRRSQSQILAEAHAAMALGRRNL